MSYYANPGHIPYDEWFDQNIDPYDLKSIKKGEGDFSSSVHEEFYKLSSENLIIGGSEMIKNLMTLNQCQENFCPLSDEELLSL